MFTVYQVDPAGHAGGRALFERAGVSFDRPFWEAAFDGLMPARLFLDDPHSPASALLTRTYDFFLAGEASPAIIALLQDAPDEPPVYKWFYGFVPLTSSWLEGLLAAFPGLFEEERRAFRLGESGAHAALDWERRVPPDLQVVPLDSALARRADDEIPDEIATLWGGYEQFTGGGWGYAALDRHDRVLSVAYTAGVTAREINIGVGTAEAARRRGLGKLLCQACIARAIASCLEVTWDCDRVNNASGALAESLGFVEEAPFTELAFPDPARGMPHRLTPSSTGHPWLRTIESDVTIWIRA